jgi:hypothetical protein
MATSTETIEVESYRVSLVSAERTRFYKDIILIGKPSAHGIRWNVILNFQDAGPASGHGIVSFGDPPFPRAVAFLGGTPHDFATWYEVVRSERAVTCVLTFEEIIIPSTEGRLFDIVLRTSDEAIGEGPADPSTDRAGDLAVPRGEAGS